MGFPNGSLLVLAEILKELVFGLVARKRSANSLSAVRLSMRK
jgi:hypothetical protein